ncbi:hypothetical protein [Primorskyibacter sp. 2E233]|uniref:hypothetical protein n=1 Tax=Primorskyibacter sp. 2E233 TaxID=3413431 RepID=UPI003BF30E86
MTQKRKNLTNLGGAAIDPGLNILFLAAFPLVLWLFQDSTLGIVTALIEMLLFAVALRLISSGQKIQDAYNAAEVAHRPRVPRKVIGSLLIGVMVMILAGMHYDTLIFPLMIGGVALGLSLTSFGIDPLQDKGLDNPEVLARIEAAEYLVQTEDTLIELSERVAELGDADLTLQTDAARDLATRIARAFSSDARDLTRLRKPMAKFIEILSTEITRLEEAWHGEDYFFARRRYVAKVKILAESFEERARRGGVKSGRDVFDMEADMLLGRMPQENAA